MPQLTLRITSTDPAEPSPSTRHVRRAHIASEVLRANKLGAGDWVVLLPRDGDGADLGVVVQLWPRAGLDDDAIALSPGAAANVTSDKVTVHPLRPGSLKGVAKDIALVPAPANPALGAPAQPNTERESSWVLAALKEGMMSARYLRKGQRVIIGDEAGSTPPVHYLVETIKPSEKKRAELADGMSKLDVGEPVGEWYEMDWRTAVTIGTNRTAGQAAEQSKPLPSYINLFTPAASASYAELGGLATQISQIRTMLELPLSRPDLFALFGLTPPRGILLHGPPGTGKTALARAVAASTACSCIVVNGPELSSAYHGESEERLRGVFDEARKRAPCIVVLDEIDALCPRRDGDGGEVEKRVVATLLTLMDGMSGGQGVFVIAATNRPNSIDPALRRPGRFDREIEIPIPDAQGREGILDILLAKMPHTLSRADIKTIAGRTHGFVGADLTSLVREAAVAAIQRGTSPPRLEYTDIEAALPTIRPSTMREVFLEMPEVRWSDIGGQDEVKQKLRECVEWPLTHAETFRRLGVRAPRGVLLYGPPGCSKTMTAKALATESGINFIAIKGPELLNKYVGESERAVREIFRKARAASPSIVFIDEIDALGTARSDDMVHNGVLTSLLNEMDGIEELAGVTVVAATNRPDVLDSALMRPGRLDRILFVGAPDLATRADIFRINLARMAVQPGVDVLELARIAEGCSGAEVASICQDAALAAMNEDIEAPFVKQEHLIHSARTVRRRITPEMIHFFEGWRDESGVRSA